jgi:hypothetical protein
MGLHETGSAMLLDDRNGCSDLNAQWTAAMSPGVLVHHQVLGHFLAASWPLLGRFLAASWPLLGHTPLWLGFRPRNL